MHYSFNPQLYEKDTVVIWHYGDFTTLELNTTEISFYKILFHGRYVNVDKASRYAWLSISGLKLNSFYIFSIS